MTENNLIYSKKLCMSELRASHSLYKSAHYYDAGAGRIHSSFVFLLSGSGTLYTAGRSIHVSAGDLFYIPEGIRYHSVYTGTPDVEFYSLEIVSKRPDDDAPRYAMARIPELSTSATGECFAKIYSLFETGERIEKIKAIGEYYTFYAEALLYLSPEAPTKLHPALGSALDYIEQNAEKNFDISDLAAYCCVSESRLYHIFKARLGTTPIRYRNELRIENAAEALRTTDLSIDEIAARCGFHSSSYFRETFRQITGLTPSEYRMMVGK
ncbi:MAG: helix-turn-helix domain-containing protein [Clostridia bacterium]|nr:helix-turn-helix domain-containing protein [Clostridia bacterium]